MTDICPDGMFQRGDHPVFPTAFVAIVGWRFPIAFPVAQLQVVGHEALSVESGSSVPRAKQPVAITGVWLLSRGPDAFVLVEVDGAWRRCIVERLDGNFSHIIEPSGIRKAPIDDDLTRAAGRADG